MSRVIGEKHLIPEQAAELCIRPPEYHPITAIFGSANFTVEQRFRLNILSRLPNFRSSIPLVDLKAQRQAISAEIETAIARVVERCDFILGEEVFLFARAVGLG
jgi:hypothetical protein